MKKSSGRAVILMDKERDQSAIHRLVSQNFKRVTVDQNGNMVFEKK